MWGRRGSTVFLCLVLFCTRLRLQARAQTDFTSIDCGSTVDYTDNLGIDWVADEGYTAAGQNAVIDITKANLGGDSMHNRRKLQTLRYFPGPVSKNCYNFPVTASEKHLIRLMFLGGNFTSELGTPPAFSISLGNAYWQDVEVTDPWTPIVKEASFYALEAILPICFQRGSSGLPFVNSIEIRLLAPISYQLTLSSYIYTTLYRLDCGLKSGSPSTRYPDDPLDRIWAADPQNFSIPSFTNSSATVDNSLTITDNEAPPVALQSAWNASRISFTWPFAPSTVPTDMPLYYIALYFVEIAGVKSTAVRELDVYVDGALLDTSPNVNPIELSNATYQAWSIKQVLSLTNVTIVPNANSTVPGALLNAAEVYRLQTYNTSFSTSTADVNALVAIQRQFRLTQWQDDPCLVWPYDWLKCSDPAQREKSIAEVTALNLSDFNLTGNIPAEIGGLMELQELALDNNNLTGGIPDFSALSNLKYLRLQNNQLSGPIPEFLGSLPLLTVLTLDNNRFEGGVPSGLRQKIDTGVLTFSATENPYLCFGKNLCLQSPSSAPSSPEKDDNKSSSVVVVVGAVAGGVVVLFVVLLFLYFRCIRKPAPKPEGLVGGRSPAAGGLSVGGHQLKSFSWAELTAATRDFSKLLGKGGYGDVYYGQLTDGRKVAVKVNKGNTKHGKHQFLNEVSLLSRVHHRHLVSFVGYCNEGNHEILVYDYMAQGTLEDHLKGSRSTNTGFLNWKTRLDILLNASKGIEYLHNSCTPPIIHRDIKTANILLTEHLVAKVSDFGISKPTREEDRTRGVTTDVKGSFGYLDPAYFSEHRLTQKSDVYSFGVVMLEAITGKPPTTIHFPNSRASNLQEWVQSKVRDGDIGAITDPAMGSNYKVESVWKVTEVAFLCLQQNVTERPDMTRVLQDLTEAMEHETQQTAANVYTSPSNLPPSAFDHYQRVHDTPRGTSRGNSSRSSHESLATFSSYDITAR